MAIKKAKKPKYKVGQVVSVQSFYFAELGQFIGTFQLHGGGLVFHLFEVKP